VKNLAATKVQRARQASPLKPHDALVLLADDHAALLAMFRDYGRRNKSATAMMKGKLALRICHLLSIHAAMEEEIFYPAAARVLGKKGEDLLAEAQVEHEVIKGLIAKLEQTSARQASFDSTVKVLGAHAAHHFEKEEEELFAELRHSKLDLAGIGERLAARQLELATASPDKNVFREGRRVLAG
jgi:hypothetical protein